MNIDAIKRIGIELRRAIDMFVQSVTDDSVMMEFTNLYPAWEELLAKGTPFKAKTIFSYGTNSVGDPQLYSFISDYLPQAIYAPDVDISHYKKHGISPSGVAIWTQPYCKEDSYGLYDLVFHIDDYYASLHPFNAWEPGGAGVPEGLWLKVSADWVPPDSEQPEEPPAEPPVEPPEEPEDPPVDPPVEYNSNGTVKWGEWVNWMGDPSKLYNAGDGVTTGEGARRVSNYNGNGTPPSDPGWWRDA